MNIKTRLSIMEFLQLAVWGAYLTCMGNCLGKVGLGSEIAFFYAVQAMISIFMPPLIGIMADKFMQPQKLFGLCHGLAGVFMLACWYTGMQDGLQAQMDPAHQSMFIALFVLSSAFYMPTLSLNYSVAYTTLRNGNYDVVKDFPPIRMWATIGFICSMWFVNCAVWDGSSFGFTLDANDNKFQYTYMQFFVSGVLGVILAMYSFTLPECKLVKTKSTSLSDAFGLSAFKLLKQKKMCLFFLFSFLLAMSLQVTNSYAGPFISSFKSSTDPVIANSFAANNATLLTSISQISEAFCILLIPFFLKRYGIKGVLFCSMIAWVMRFGFFGLGGPTMPGVLLFILSCIVYGMAFDFFNVSGSMFVDMECDASVKSSAQGLFFMITNGLGATLGMYAASAVVDAHCSWENGVLVGDWTTCWYTFAGYALAVAIAFVIFFRDSKPAPAK